LQENFDRFNNALYKEKEMADFRRSMIVLAAIALLLATVGTVSAASMTCTSNAAATQMRAEGQTEKGGDFILTCTGGTPTDPLNNAPVVNITVFLNTTDVTSRILTASDNATEALLMFDEPAEANQKVCSVANEQTNSGPTPSCPVVGFGASATDPYAAPAFNVFQGQWGGLTARNEIIFSGVPIAAPGTMGGTRTIRITNIRANASEVAIAVSGAPSSVTETLGVSNPTVLPITSNNATQTIGLVQLGLITTVGTPAPSNFPQCVSTTLPNGLAGVINLNKGFGAAFKVRNQATTPTAPTATIAQDVPGGTYNTETFFYNPVTISTAIGAAEGLADAGTRFRVKFTGVPAGVTVAVPVDAGYIAGSVNGIVYGQNTPTPAPNLYVHLTAGEVGGYSALSGDDTSTGTCGTAPCANFYDVQLDSTGAGEAVYEVLQANTSSLTEFLSIPFYISYTASPGTNSPAINVQAGVEASFAPVLSDAAAPMASEDQVPRFVDLSKVLNAFIINSCATHLLFPYITNLGGFDTGIAISNTSLDEYGTSPQAGICNIYAFTGGKGLAAYPTPSIPAGSTWAALIDGATTPIVAPNSFSGYMIADCNFQYAHGFSFITQVGTFLGTEGYLALIIPDPPKPRNASPFPGAGAASGEQLGY
jgi:hypothetical protein